MKNWPQKVKWLIVLGIFFLILLLGVVLFALKEYRAKDNNLFSPSKEKISIHMDSQGLVPFDIMVIDGQNLDPAAATSVIFKTFSKQTITVPAISVTPTKIEVPVPPLAYNKDSGKFSLDAIKIVVVQVKKEGDKLVVNSSNEQAAISVVFPVAPSVLKRSDAKKIPAGTITKGFVVLAIRRLNSIAAQVPADNRTVKDSIAKSLAGLQELSDGLDAYIKNSKSKIILSDVAGNKVEIGSAEVAWLDAFYSGFLGLAEERQLLAAGEKSFSPVPVAQAAGTACANNWEAATDPVKIINLQLDCLYNRIVEPKTDGLEGDNWENKSLDIMQSLSLGFSADGFGFEKQIAYAIGGYLGPLNPPMTRLIKPVGPNVPFLVIMALGQLLITSNDICSALPDYCYRRDYTIADPFNLREFLFLKYDIDDSLVYRFETPEQFNNFMYGSDDYDAQTLPKVDPVTDLKPTPAPVSPEPIKYTVPKQTPTLKPTPTPSPTPSPTPAPDEPVCAESRDTTYNKCLVFCEGKKPQQATLDACYASCSSAADKLVCENNCRADWFSALSASSSCFSGCLDAYSASKCY